MAQSTVINCCIIFSLSVLTNIWSSLVLVLLMFLPLVSLSSKWLLLVWAAAAEQRQQFVCICRAQVAQRSLASALPIAAIHLICWYQYKITSSMFLLTTFICCIPATMARATETKCLLVLLRCHYIATWSVFWNTPPRWWPCYRKKC